MNNFCEECGNKLTPYDLFCEQCGAKIQPSNPTEEAQPAAAVFDNESDFTYTFFENRNSKAQPKPDTYYGIILTNFKKIAATAGEAAGNALKKNLQQYITELKKRGICYLVLDASNNQFKNLSEPNWKRHVNLLRKASNKISKQLGADTRFLLILGGHEIIPMPVFENPTAAKSRDKDVDTDLPYSTLSVGNLLEDATAREPLLPVGRIPTGNKVDVNHIANVLANTLQAIPKMRTDKTFGLSANCWQAVSSEINSRVANDQLYISPGLTIENLSQYYSPDAQLHYFNLHGSDKSAAWFGQKGDAYPVAFSPQAIIQNRQYNIVGVEACYGARFIGLDTNESILLSALAGKTVSFVGSSRIAWGPSAPPMNLADVVIHDFLARIQQGQTAGEALLQARINGFNNSVERDPATSLLTLMEFNLFGDPVFFLGSEQAHKTPKTTKSLQGEHYEELQESEMAGSKANNSQSDSMYDVVKNAVDEAQRKIIDLINQNVWEKYPEFKNIEPAFKKYSFEGKSYNNLTYKKEQEEFDKYVSVSTDAQGNVLAEFESK